jgi:hypothetical protein
MEEEDLDYAVGFFTRGYSRTPANFAWESLKTAGWLKLTLSSAGNRPVGRFGVGQPRLGQALNLSKERLQVGAVVFDRRRDKLLFFNVLESAVSPADEVAVRAQVRRVFRDFYPEIASSRPVSRALFAN